MKTFMACVWGVIVLGTVGALVDLFLTSHLKQEAFKRACDFVLKLKNAPLEDREILIERFKETDPDAAVYLVVGTGAGVRFKV